MREIKFRSWNGKDIAYGMTVVSPTTTEEGGETLMQYTGLKDSNGVEIYEGDIVKYHNRKDSYELHQIIYEEKAAAFLLFGANPASRHPVFVKYLGDIVKAGKSYDIRTYEPCEVIGNIYENPELLREDK